jgi:outer membrane protein TolC
LPDSVSRLILPALSPSLRFRPGVDLPALGALIERAESSRGDLTAFRKEIDAANFSARAAERRRLPEPEVIAGTKSSTVGGGDIGSVFTVQATVPLFDRGKIERAIATARADQAEAAAAAFRVSLRADITSRAAVSTARDCGAIPAAAVTSVDELSASRRYDAGERGILELLDAYRTQSRQVKQAPTRRPTGDRASKRGRSGNETANWLALSLPVVDGVPQAGRCGKSGSTDVDVTLNRQDRAVHGISAAQTASQ